MKHSDIFYFDVDGTILHNETHQISEKTLESLRQVKKKGYRVALCTGRTYKGIHEAGVEDLLDWDAYVLANGSLVLDKNMELLSKQSFDPKIVKRVMEASEAPLLLEGDENFLTGEANEAIQKALDHFGIDEDYPVIEYNNQDVYNIMCYSELDEKTIAFLKDNAQILYDQLGNYELIPLKSGKDHGIQVVNEHYQVQKHTVFGDGDNDVSMIKAADVSVAMANGTEDVKEAADYVTKSVEEDGVYHALKFFGIID